MARHDINHTPTKKLISKYIQKPINPDNLAKIDLAYKLVKKHKKITRLLTVYSVIITLVAITLSLR